MNNQIMVSICSTTYNHAKFIRQCLDGFLMQKVNFKYEILIHDDASTDGTDNIIREYAEKYPNIIKPLFETENQYRTNNPKGMVYWNVSRANGKYIALCEGDDYWTDPLKLQKQVDFLEVNPDYVMCSHCYLVYDQEQETLCDGINSEYEIHYDITSLVRGLWYHHTLTVLFRREALHLDEYNRYPRQMDATLFYYLLKDNKKGVLLKDCMAVYRVHNGGVWSMVGIDKQREDEFETRLGICSIENSKYAAMYLKSQFFKSMSRKWMLKNKQIISTSLKIIYTRLGFMSMLKSIASVLMRSMP